MSEPRADPAAPNVGAPETPRAWQPFTPRGIAAFADARFGGLFIAQLIVALLAAGAVVWFLWSAWCPAIRESIRNLPGQGVVEQRQLSIPDLTETRLVTNRFLTFIINLTDQRQNAVSADLYLVLRRDHYEACSLFGCAAWPYPAVHGPFTRLELEPQWTAWEPFLLGIAGVATSLGLLVAWWVLATVYFLFARTLAFFNDREITLGGCWKVCAAALLPAALLLSAAIVAYGFSVIDLIRLLIVAVLHVLAPPVLIIFAILARGRVSPKGAPNPFASAGPAPNEPQKS